MKAIVLATLLLSAVASFNVNHYAAEAATRQNCRLTNAGGCVKLGNGWMEFCPAEGAERIDGADKNDRDCVSVKPFSLIEYSTTTNERYVIKANADEMDFAPVGGYSRHTFTSDCSDISMACAITPASIDAVKFTVAMNTTGTSEILIDLYVFSQGGTLSYDNNQYSVTAGSFKFDIRSENYVFAHPNCDAIAIQVEMKTLGGAIGAQIVDRGNSQTFIDGIFRSPNRFTYVDTAGAYQWGGAKTEKVLGANGKQVISFDMAGIPSNGTFRFDPFVTVPAPKAADNGSANTRAMGALVAFVGAVVGLLAL